MHDEFICGARLDKVVGTYSAVTSLIDSLQDEGSFAADGNIRIAACFDNEEVQFSETMMDKARMIVYSSCSAAAATLRRERRVRSLNGCSVAWPWADTPPPSRKPSASLTSSAPTKLTVATPTIAANTMYVPIQSDSSSITYFVFLLESTALRKRRAKMRWAGIEPGTLRTGGTRRPLGQLCTHGVCVKNAICTALFCPPFSEGRTFRAVLSKKTKSLITPYSFRRTTSRRSTGAWS